LVDHDKEVKKESPSKMKFVITEDSVSKREGEVLGQV
jgi:hypothetical protein